MTYARLRIALTAAVGVLLLLAGPATARVQRPSQYARTTTPVATAHVPATSPAAPPAVAAPDRQQEQRKQQDQDDEPDRPVRAHPVRSKPAGGPSAGPGSPSPDAGRFGPAGSLKYTGSAAVALPFDAGPALNTPRILDLLKQHGVKATFCLVGFRARDHPDLVRRIAAEGHTFCNHSWQHLLNLASRPVDYINWDLSHTNEVIRSIVPGAKIPYFR